MSIGLGKAIAARRITLGLSRKALAEKAGISYPFLAEIEKGTKSPSFQRLGDIAAALDMTRSRLVAVSELTADALFGSDTPT